MNTFNKTDTFADWLDQLRDVVGRAKVLIRIKRAQAGNFGDCESLGDGIFEMRVTFGPGYRVYYAQEGTLVYLLLCGGDKSTQSADIRYAKAMWKSIKESS